MASDRTHLITVFLLVKYDTPCISLHLNVRTRTNLKKRYVAELQVLITINAKAKRCEQNRSVCQGTCHFSNREVIPVKAMATPYLSNMFFF
jgi:hypothetical protein